MLIVEGPDGAGKTTLVTKLGQLLGWPVSERVVAQDTTITGGRSSLKSWVDENLDHGFQPVIFDRHRLISEPIYGPIMRDGLQAGFDDPTWFMGRWLRFVQLKPTVVFCLPPLEDVQKNIDGDAKNEEVGPHIDQIYWHYFTAFCQWPNGGLRYDYTHTTKHRTTVERIAAAARAQLAWWTTKENM